MYYGPPIDDHEILSRLPEDLRNALLSANGYVAYHGGLHVRGACLAPTWHSIRAAWDGPSALHLLFPAIRPTDVPFAEDILGDQFVVRDGAVFHLTGETGELRPFADSLGAFEQGHLSDPDTYLSLQPLGAFRADGGTLGVGQLLSVHPPFCTAEAGQDVSYRAIDALELRAWLADFARQISGLADGTKLTIEIRE